MVDSQKFTSGATIGLAVGLPVGVFCLGLALFLGLSSMRKKLALNRRKSTDSTTLESDDDDRGWLSKVMYGNGSQYGQEYIYEKSLPLADSSTIQYKVSKSKPQHILTPKAPKLRDDSTSLEGMSVRDDIDALLYSKPPNIYHIQSEMPSASNLPGEKLGFSVSSPSKRPKPADLELPLHKWRYESPLSSWFLRNSTYLGDDEFGDGAANAETIVTPTVQLKQLKILSRINKDYANGSQLLENEKCPILEKSQHNSQENTPLGNGIAPTSSSYAQTGSAPLSVLYGTVNSSELEKNPFGHPHNHQNNNDKERKGRRESISGHDLQKITDEKSLPLTPGNDFKNTSHAKSEVGHVCKVAQNYKAILADEIDIQIGEFVLILATHTDGWCLVEKCTEDGTSKSYLKTGETATDANDKHYLNGDRGIVPGDCLNDV